MPQSAPHPLQRKAHLEDIVVHVENFQAYYQLDADIGQANSRPLGSVAELPFLPRGVLDLYDVGFVVLLIEKVTQPAAIGFPRASSNIIQTNVSIMGNSKFIN